MGKNFKFMKKVSRTFRKIIKIATSRKLQGFETTIFSAKSGKLSAITEHHFTKSSQNSQTFENLFL